MITNLPLCVLYLFVHSQIQNISRAAAWSCFHSSINSVSTCYSCCNPVSNTVLIMMFTLLHCDGVVTSLWLKFVSSFPLLGHNSVSCCVILFPLVNETHVPSRFHNTVLIHSNENSTCVFLTLEDISLPK